MSGPQAPAGLRLFAWSSAPVLGVALVAMAAGFGQFGAVAALGDVAKSFGHVVSGNTVADQAGLSGTELGTGLAVLRLASLAALPLAGLGDRLGRRKVLLVATGLGLVLTVAAAASPGYWWFVAIFALGRPMLSSSSALGQVIVSEVTSSEHRAKAVALVTAGYGIGSGLTALLHGAASGSLGFRGLFLLAAVPLVLLPAIGRMVIEPDRYLLTTAEDEDARPVIEAGLRRRLVWVMVLAFAVAFTSGPATGFVYLDAQDIVKLPGFAVSMMVLSAGVAGALGLFAGQWLADRLGRRPTGMAAMIAIAGLSMFMYSGSKVALFVGYVLAICSASLLAPTAGAFANELFPTEVRARVSGWLVVASVIGAVGGLLCFGAISDAGGSLFVAAVVTFAPSALLSSVFFMLPETRGMEPEQVTPA